MAFPHILDMMYLRNNLSNFNFLCEIDEEWRRTLVDGFRYDVDDVKKPLNGELTG